MGPRPERPSAPALRFRRTAERVLDALLEVSPDRATLLGDHRFDDRTTELSLAGVSRRVTVLTEAAAALDALEDSTLEPSDRVDLEILRSAVTAEVWADEELATHRHDPLVHLPTEGLLPLLDRPGLDPGQRLTGLTSRLSAVPARLAVAREVLTQMPRVHVETAAGRSRALARHLDARVDDLAAAHPRQAAGLVATRDDAVAALLEHAGWLEAQLPTSDGNPRLGPERYAARLWYVLDSELTPDALLTRAESDLQAVEEEIAELASRIAGAPPRTGQVREVLDRLAAEAPVDDATVASCTAQAVAAATARVRELALAGVPDEAAGVSVRMVTRPGLPLAACDGTAPLRLAGPPGPLEPTTPAVLDVRPTPPGWSAQRVASFYREFNGHALRVLATHHAIPGHLLQLWRAAGHRGTTRVRRALPSATFVAGWAGYVESLMALHGLGDGLDDALRMHQLKRQLSSTINAVLDVRVHARGMTRKEGMSLLTERGHQHEEQAAGTWRRALLSSAQLSAPYVGHQQLRLVVQAVRRARPAARPRQVHDWVLAHGAPPPRHLTALLGITE